MHEELMIWFAQAVAHSLWMGLVIGALAWVLMHSLRKSPARQYGVLCGALLLVALSLPVTLVVLTPEFADLRIEGTTQAEAPATAAGEPIVVEGVWLDPNPLPSPPMTEEVTPMVESDSAVAARFKWESAAPWVVGVYALGLLAMLARLLVACGGSRRLRRHAIEVSEESWRESFRRVLRRLELKTEPVMAWSSEVAAPVLVGALKPMVLLPLSLANRLTMEQAEAVLAHELAHLRRYDQWILMVQRVVETVLFYHPVVWWMSRQLSRTREQACDDVVLASGSLPADYAETLVLCSELRLAAVGLEEGSAMQLAATGSKGTSLRHRVLRVLGQDDPIRPGKGGWLLAGAIALALVIAGASLFPPAEAQKPADPAGVTEETPGASAEPAVPGAEVKDPPAPRVPNENEPAPAEPEPSEAILMEIVLAEVVDGHPVSDKTVSRKALSKVGKIVAEPKLILASGKQGKVETNRPAEIADPRNPRLITYSVEVTPMLRREHVQYTVKVTRAEEAGQGTKLLLSGETAGVTMIGVWKAIEVGPLLGGAKLVGAVRFLPAKAGQVINAPGVFQVLANGKVNWLGNDYTVAELKDVLPQVGGEAVIRAGRDARYQAVVDLVNVLKPVFKRGVSFVVDDPEAGNPVRERKQAWVELMEAEEQSREMRTRYRDKYPRLRELTALIEDLRSKLPRGKEADEWRRHWTKLELRDVERELRVLRERYRSKHPRILQLEQRLQSLEEWKKSSGKPPWEKGEEKPAPAADDLVPEKGSALPEEGAGVDPFAPSVPEGSPAEDLPPEVKLPLPPTVRFVPREVPAPAPREEPAALPVDLDQADKTEGAVPWYNALPDNLAVPAPGELAEDPEAFYQESYPLYVPGALSPKGDKKLKNPSFAIGMNSRLQQRDKEGDADPESLASILKPLKTEILLERGLPGSEREKQASYQGIFFPPAGAKPKPRAFAARHHQKGMLLFVDGQVHVLRDLLNWTPEGAFPNPGVFESDIVWESAARRELSRLEKKLQSERQGRERLKELEAQGEKSPTRGSELEARVKEVEQQVEFLRRALARQKEEREKKKDK